MIIAIIMVVLSFLLDGFISNYFAFSLTDLSYFTTIYTLIALIVLTPHFNNDKKYFVLIIIIGLFFDLVYTNTFLLNVILFVIICIVARILNFFLAHNLLNINIIALISIFLYYLLSLIVLTLVNYNDYSFILLLNIFTHSILMTVIYTSIIYLTIKFLYQKFNIKEIK